MFQSGCGIDALAVRRATSVRPPIFTRSLRDKNDFLRLPYASKPRVAAVLIDMSTRVAAMDAWYLLLLIALVGSTAAFLRLCARLEDKP